jgi:xylulokinase
MSKSTIKDRGGDKKSILVFDIGTTGLSALVLDAITLQQIGETGKGSYDTYTNPAGHIMQDPREHIYAAQAAMMQIHSQGILRERQVASIGISGQMHAGVLLDESRNPLSLASLWNCPRATEEGEYLTRLFGVKVDRRLTLSHMLWLKRHKPLLMEDADVVTTPGGYLGYWLTEWISLGAGEYSGLGFGKNSLFESRKALLKEDAHLLDLAPNVIQAGEILDLLDDFGADFLGIPKNHGTIVAAPEGDQPAGTIGVGITSPGYASLMLGASGVLNSIDNGPIEDPSGTVDFFSDAFGNALNMGLIVNCMQISDAVVSQFEGKGLGTGSELIAALEEKAKYVRANCNGQFRWNLPNSETFLGLPGGIKKSWGLEENKLASPGHEMRIALSSIAVLLRRRLKNLCPSGNYPKELVVGGGGSNSDLLLQIIADCLQVPIRRPSLAGEASALGAGCLALLAEEAHNGNLEVSPAEFVDSICPKGGETFTPQTNGSQFDHMDRKLDELIKEHRS